MIFRVIILVLFSFSMVAQTPTRVNVAKLLTKSNTVGSVLISDGSNEYRPNGSVIWNGSNLEVGGSEVYHEGNSLWEVNGDNISNKNIANVGIGLTNPNPLHRLDVLGTTNSTQYKLEGTSTVGQVSNSRTLTNKNSLGGNELYYEEFAFRKQLTKELDMTGFAAGDYYNLNTYDFLALQGVFNISVLVYGSGYGASMTYEIPVSYNNDYLNTAYGGSANIFNTNEWVNLSAKHFAGRGGRIVSQDNGILVQARIPSTDLNSIQFRVVATRVLDITPQLFLRLEHSDNFRGCTIIEDYTTGNDVNYATYNFLPYILGGKDREVFVPSDLKLYQSNFITNNGWISNNGLDNGLFVNSANRVGVNTSSPSQALDVNGFLRLRSTSSYPTSNEFCVFGSATGDVIGRRTLNNIIQNHTLSQNLQTNNLWLSNDGDNEGIYISTTGKVGIQNNTPNYDLDLSGSMHIEPLLVGSASGDYFWTDEGGGILNRRHISTIPDGIVSANRSITESRTITGNGSNNLIFSNFNGFVFSNTAQDVGLQVNAGSNVIDFEADTYNFQSSFSSPSVFDFNNAIIQEVRTPTADDHAANKGYVDAQISDEFQIVNIEAVPATEFVTGAFVKGHFRVPSHLNGADITQITYSVAAGTTGSIDVQLQKNSSTIYSRTINGSGYSEVNGLLSVATGDLIQLSYFTSNTATGDNGRGLAATLRFRK